MGVKKKFYTQDPQIIGAIVQNC